MKTILLITSLFLFSCANQEQSHIDQEMEEAYNDLKHERLKLAALERAQLNEKEIPRLMALEPEVEQTKENIMNLETILRALAQEKFDNSTKTQ